MTQGDVLVCKRAPPRVTLCVVALNVFEDKSTQEIFIRVIQHTLSWLFPPIKSRFMAVEIALMLSLESSAVSFCCYYCLSWDFKFERYPGQPVKWTELQTLGVTVSPTTTFLNLQIMLLTMHAAWQKKHGWNIYTVFTLTAFNLGRSASNNQLYDDNDSARSNPTRTEDVRQKARESARKSRLRQKERVRRMELQVLEYQSRITDIHRQIETLSLKNQTLEQENYRLKQLVDQTPYQSSIQSQLPRSQLRNAIFPGESNTPSFPRPLVRSSSSTVYESRPAPLDTTQTLPSPLMQPNLEPLLVPQHLATQLISSQTLLQNDQPYVTSFPGAEFGADEQFLQSLRTSFKPQRTAQHLSCRHNLFYLSNVRRSFGLINCL